MIKWTNSKIRLSSLIQVTKETVLTISIDSIMASIIIIIGVAAGRLMM
ncbi:MAG: hypothetical protein WB815_09655 [Nitrososphaeraceae archaeon]